MLQYQPLLMLQSRGNNDMKDNAPIALSFSGGGARGWVHIGVLQAMEEAGCTPAYLSGCSSGAIVGALYASQHSPQKILSLVKDLKIHQFLRPIINRRGLFSLKPLEKWLQQYLPNTFEELSIPLSVSATALGDSKVVKLSKGSLIPAILASSCLPVLFNPVAIEGQLLVDGGVMENLPVNEIEGEHFQYWASCSNYSGTKTPTNYLQIVERTLRLAIDQNTMMARIHCDLIFEPTEMQDFRIFDFRRAQRIYEIGYNHAREVIGKNS